ncbi:MAG: GntR family transcriptional regulator [Lachnospiraceae bacterium]|nr:GntR family transcriptional regulator [Lachnospiraceae bacterium]
MIVLDFKSSKPIYEQIIEQMKFHILKGHLKSGDAIPSVRKLALDLSITPGTVAKAYQELERSHMIETIRGKGTFIAGNIEIKPDEDKIRESKKQMRSAILELKVMGLSEEEVIQFVHEIFEEMSV